jgi:hypothetical protein
MKWVFDEHAILRKHSFGDGLLVLFVLGLIFTGIVEAATIRVPVDAPTIQAGIIAASNGDTVLVAPGTYSENISFGGKAITVTSQEGPEVTIINANHLPDSAVTFAGGEGLSSILSGFTITKARTSFGGGIVIRGASPTIVNNIISHNQACFGPGILMLQSGALIHGNDISGNSVEFCGNGNGGGILVFDANGAQITGNRIFSNSSVFANSWGGGILVTGASTVTIRDNFISGNSASFGGGIFVDANNLSVQIDQNVIVGNMASGGAGIAGWMTAARLVNNTIVNNGEFHASSLFLDGLSNALIANNIVVAEQNRFSIDCLTPINPDGFKHNNLFNQQGFSYGATCGDQTGVNGNISVDPVFLNPLASDFQLRLDSPLIDAGTNAISGLPGDDFDGSPRISDGDSNGVAVIDMGAFEFGDTVPPTITSVTATPDVLLQANHQMVPVSIRVSASDNSGQAVSCRIISVTSNEPVEGLGDGDTAPDWLVTGNLTLNIRAERSGKGSGRVYTINIECSDTSDNLSSKDVSVTVPRNN